MNYFINANLYLLNQYFKEFSGILSRVYSEVSCDAIIYHLKGDYLAELLYDIKKVADPESNYDLNISKGFLYLKNNYLEQAYFYLSRSLVLKQDAALPFILRGEIDLQINSHMENDMEQAAHFGQSVRNKFRYSDFLFQKNDMVNRKKGMDWFEKALKSVTTINPIYLKHEGSSLDANYDDVMKGFVELINKNTNGTYLFLCIWYYLEQITLFDEALEYATLGNKVTVGKDARYQLLLGLSNHQIKNFKEAIYHYKCYKRALKIDHLVPVESLIKQAQYWIDQRIISKAEVQFKAKNYRGAIKLFQLYCRRYEVIYGPALNTYLLALLKDAQPAEKFDEGNPIYKRIDQLKRSYQQKLESGAEISNDEDNANKLMRYEKNHTIGFGKHKDQIILDLIERDPSYILWCIIYLDHFSIDPTLFCNEKLKDETLFIPAIRYNHIKGMLLNKWNENEEDDDFEGDYDNSGRNDWNRETFNALTDGQMGDYEDFNGNIDDIMTWSGR